MFVLNQLCYAIIKLTPVGLEQPLVNSQSQAGKLDTLPHHASVDKLSHHAVALSQAREVRHAIPPACIIQTSYRSMQLPGHRPGKLEMLSHHAVKTNHKSVKSYILFQHAQSRQVIPACTVKYAVYKRGCKSPEQCTS